MPPKRTPPVEAAIDGEELASLLSCMPASPVMKDYEQFVACVEGIIRAYQQRKKTTWKSIPASKLDSLREVILMFELDHRVGHSDYVLASKKDDAEVEVSPWLQPALESLNTDFWRLDSAEALYRTPIDLVINERLGRMQSKTSFKNLALMAEKPMIAEVPGGMGVVTGDMDYVVGYGGLRSFVSSLIVVEAKRPQSFSGGLAQCTAYLEGLRQRREAISPTRMSTKVYGIVSDGSDYVFLRLEGKRLDVSLRYQTVIDSEFRKMINMLDDVLESALTSTPHTTPNKTFPATSTALRAEDGHRFRLHPDAFQGMLRIPPSQYIVDLEIKDDQEDTEVDYYDILMRTPTRTLPEV